MPPICLTLTCETPDQTATLARRIGADLAPGDTLLLSGPIGAGKTHFARSLIQSLLSTPEDVPSPTFTLVQTYDTPQAEIWHADLYRLTALDEIEELGLTEAFDTAICLIEWPDRLGSLQPADALELEFETKPNDPDLRRVTIRSANPKWAGLGGGRDA